MNLKSLEVQGFKSFPDKTLIRFGEDITAIVGPNGSGKSNISDAIVWVMGEQSTKTLRGTKMEDVIFGGTQKRPAVGFAEATLTFDNADRSLAYDADEVMITRRYYRSGDSEYYINRQSARLRDINELLMDTGLGREGYSNIGQGRIDEILAQKSADRREVFEEAAGISKYRHRKEETERKLAATEDNLLRIGDLISELENQLTPLKEQSEKAKKYLLLKDELQGVEVAVWLDQLEKLSAAAQKAERDHASASFVLQQAHDDLEALYRRAEELGELLHTHDAALDQMRAQGSALEAEKQTLESQCAVLRGNRENNDLNIARIREELRGAQDRSGGITEQLTQTYARIDALESELTQTETALAQLEAQLIQLSDGAQGAQKRYLELRSAESALLSDLALARERGAALTQSIEENTQRLERLNSDIEAGLARKEQAESALRDCRAQLKAASDTVAAHENTVSGYALRLKGREQRRDTAAQEVRSITTSLDAVSAKVKVYRAMERDYESYQKSVRLVMQQSQRGTLHNLCGPVSQLIRTDDEYTVAIEIALGSAMQHIVVQTESDAKAAISFLKRTGGGRATFLPISVIRAKSLGETGLSNSVGFVGIASDLVRCDEAYRAVVENLLGRTVIAHDLDAALAIARKYANRFRLVTLDGQVINPGGAMTGGSVNREAGILSRANELEKLTAQQTELENKLLIARSAQQDAQRAADETAFQLETAREQLRQSQDQVLRLQGQEKQHAILLQAVSDALSSAQTERDALSAKLDTDRTRVTELEADGSRSAEALEKTRIALRSHDVEQSQLTDQVAQISAQCTERKTQAAALQAERESACAHIADLEALRSAMEGDSEKKAALIDQLTDANKSLEAQLAERNEQKSQCSASLTRHQEALDKLLRERMQTESGKTRAEHDAQEKNKDILNMERACALLEQKKLTSAMEEKQIVDKLWDNYGLTPGTANEKRGAIESVAAGTRRIAELRRALAALGTPNLGAIEEYARVNERYSYLTAQRDDVLTSKRELESIIRNITKEMTSIFTTEFARIDRYFGETFTEMFGGGKGQLLLEDPSQPLSCGIEIHVQPPGKQVKTITLLSGGEKAFVAIALYFAILKVRPTPFCMLDEIDAALDDRNVERFAQYLRNLSKKTQFIVITHRRGTMEASDILYGVTMQEQGVSKLLRLDLNQMEQYLGIVE